MPLDKETGLLAVGGLSLGAWLLTMVVRLFRGEYRAHKNNEATQEVINSLRTEVARQAEQLQAKELTIQRLVEEKAKQLEKLADIPKMREEIQGLEEQVQALVQLFNHLLEAGVMDLKPEHQQKVLSIITRKSSGA